MKLFISLLLVGVSTLALANHREVRAEDYFGDTQADSIGQIDIEALEQGLGLDESMDREDHHHGRPCADVKLTEEQRAGLKKAFIAFKKEMIKNGANLKIAQIDYIVALTDATSDKTTAEGAADVLSASVSAMVDSRLGIVNGILYDILTADQRIPALKCMKAMKMHKKYQHLKKVCKKFNQHHPHKPFPQPPSDGKIDGGTIVVPPSDAGQIDAPKP